MIKKTEEEIIWKISDKKLKELREMNIQQGKTIFADEVLKKIKEIDLEKFMDETNTQLLVVTDYSEEELLELFKIFIIEKISKLINKGEKNGNN